MVKVKLITRTYSYSPVTDEVMLEDIEVKFVNCGAVEALDRYYDKVNYLDLNASYTFGKNFKTTIYAEANNLLNQPLRYYQGTKDRTMQVEYYGMKINAGVKFQF